jgi:hypothetical protein
MIAVARAMPDLSRDGHHMSDGGLTVMKKWCREKWYRDGVLGVE